MTAAQWKIIPSRLPVLQVEVDVKESLVVNVKKSGQWFIIPSLRRDGNLTAGPAGRLVFHPTDWSSGHFLIAIGAPARLAISSTGGSPLVAYQTEAKGVVTAVAAQRGRQYLASCPAFKLRIDTSAEIPAITYTNERGRQETIPVKVEK